MNTNAKVSLVFVAILLSGCLATPQLTGSRTNHPLPDKPTVFTEKTVSNYTTSYEAATIYNQYAEYTPTDDRISCQSDTRVSLNSTFVMNIQCTGGVVLGNGEHVDIASSTHYFVSETTTKRISTDEHRSVRYREYQSNGSALTSYEVVNLANDSVSVSIKLSKPNSSSLLQFDYNISPTSSVTQTGLPIDYGTTRMMDIRSDNTTTTAQFTSEPIEFSSPTVVYILPNGRIRVTVGPSEIR